jgi:CheY-like chemotaxis protein
MGSRHSKPFAPAILTSCCYDWDMPVLNGIEVLRIVFPRPNLPVICSSRGRNAVM